MLWDLSSEQLFIACSFIACSAFICGWITDRILGYAAFGVIGNWLLLGLGAFVGLYTYNAFGYRFHWDPAMTVAVAFGSGLLMLMTLLTAKAALHL